MSRRELLGFAGFLILVGFLLILVSQYVLSSKGSVLADANQLLVEYNTQLTPVNCEHVDKFYLCTVDVDINLGDVNLDYTARARGTVLLYRDGNNLILYKLDPAPTSGHIIEHNIPHYIKDALSKLTLVLGNKMLCLDVEDTMQYKEYTCYIPTNAAPLGSAQLFYAPLFHIEVNGDQVTSVIVHV